MQAVLRSFSDFTGSVVAASISSSRFAVLNVGWSVFYVFYTAFCPVNAEISSLEECGTRSVEVVTLGTLKLFSTICWYIGDT